MRYSLGMQSNNTKGNTMFRNLGTHVIKNPAGTYSFVGSLPVVLATVVDADKSAVMGGRAFRDDNGQIKMYRFPVFTTEAQAIGFAESVGVTVIRNHN